MSTTTAELPAGIKTIAIGIGDLNGIMRGKRVTAENWERARDSGTAASIALFACDMVSDVWDTPYVNMDNGYPDMHLFPATEVRPIPWEEGCGFCFGKALGMDHKPVPIDPRGVLVSQVEKAQSMGFNVQVGAELEFYLLDPETLKPRDVGNQFYGLVRASELEHVLGPIRDGLSGLGIGIEQSNPEYAPGQVEVNMLFGDALKVADNVVAFRMFVKEIAARHGYIATFMAKPFAVESGSGFHTHHSAWKDGANVFASDEGKLSDLGRSYLAGIQRRMAEAALSASTTPNAYRRRRAYTFCPTNNCWGYDNRTVGLRVIEGSASSTRIEKRDGSADCNPYYLIGCEIAAGLEGVAENLQPEHFSAGNGYELEDAEQLPADIDTAIRLARNSAFMNEVLGADRLEILAGQAERESGLIADHVTSLEVERYLRNF